MSTLSLRLPDSLHRKLKEIAAEEGVSINQFVATATAEKVSALATEEYLVNRAKRGRKGKFKKALRKVADRRPVYGDEQQEN